VGTSVIQSKRQAPSTGYNFGNKRQYRRKVWKEAATFLRGHRPTAQVMLMPSSEGAEIEVAERNGFKQSNMHVVDRNPAIVAHLKRKFPYINTYGVDVVRALRRMGDKGIVLNFANLDLCQTMGGVTPVLQEIGDMYEPFADKNLVFVTIQRGRERGLDRMVKEIEGCYGEDLPWHDEHHPNPGWSIYDKARAEWVSGLLFGEYVQRGQTACKPHIYKSKEVTMLYVGWVREMKRD
jgi:hypothetical protein